MVITDPTQTALDDAVVRGWQTYVNIVSVQHGVYLQVIHLPRQYTCLPASLHHLSPTAHYVAFEYTDIWNTTNQHFMPPLANRPRRRHIALRLFGRGYMRLSVCESVREFREIDLWVLQRCGCWNADYTVYRVAQNKPDYLLLLSKFCISTTTHVSMIMYV